MTPEMMKEIWDKEGKFNYMEYIISMKMCPKHLILFKFDF